MISFFTPMFMLVSFSGKCSLPFHVYAYPSRPNSNLVFSPYWSKGSTVHKIWSQVVSVIIWHLNTRYLIILRVLDQKENLDVIYSHLYIWISGYPGVKSIWRVQGRNVNRLLSSNLLTPEFFLVWHLLSL